MTHRPIDLCRTWLFVAGADAAAHDAATHSGADVLIQDLEDFTPPARRHEARMLAADLYSAWRAAGAVVVVRINRLDEGGMTDLDMVIPAHPDMVAYPKAASAGDMQALDAEITRREKLRGMPEGSITLLPICETALGVVNVREMAAASGRVRAALLGTEDLAADLMAERGRDAIELDYARRRFVLECRAAGIEPIDAPYTFADVDGAVHEARFARRIGYRSKSLVRPDHAAAINAALTPSKEECGKARTIITAFEAARARGEERVLVGGLWIEVPMMLTAQRLLARAAALAVAGGTQSG